MPEIVMPEISVIIVNWNGKHWLQTCLGSLRRQTFSDFEVILVDNGSQDGSVEFVCQHFPEVNVLALGENLGFTGGNIAGYALARGNLIVLLNNDTEADVDWLREIYAASVQYQAAGSFASKMMYFDNRDRIENCGFDVGRTGTTVDLGRDEPDGPEWSTPRKVFGACGGAAVYRRSMLNEIGFLDADFFMIYEDVDLSFRAQLSGYSCVYLPRAIVYHRYRSSIGQRPGLQVYYAQRNIDWVYLKNLPTSLLLCSSPQRLLYEIGAGLYFLRMGSAAAFVRAKLDVLKNLGMILRKRRLVQRQRTLSSSQLRDRMCAPDLRAKWKKLSARPRLKPEFHSVGDATTRTGSAV
jgi:GT2 family glycosyltransferase